MAHAASPTAKALLALAARAAAVATQLAGNWLLRCDAWSVNLACPNRTSLSG